MSTLTWTETLRLLFSTPMMPPPESAAPPVEIELTPAPSRSHSHSRFPSQSPVASPMHVISLDESNTTSPRTSVDSGSGSASDDEASESDAGSASGKTYSATAHPAHIDVGRLSPSASAFEFRDA